MLALLVDSPVLKFDSSEMDESRDFFPESAFVHLGEPVNREMLKSVLTDIHFWLPVVVLLLGVALLVTIH